MSIGAIGGGMGVGMGASIGGMGAVPAAAPAMAPSMGGNAPSGGGVSAPVSSTQVTISAAAQKAMATDAQQVGASFSISTDASGHHYAGGVDANGFSISVATVTQAPAASDMNLDDLVALAVLALLLKEQQQ